MRGRTKVLHVLSYFRPDFTGGGIRLERQWSAMKTISENITHDALVVYTRRPTNPIDKIDGINKLFYLSRRQVTNKRITINLFFWLIFSAKKYNIIHFHTHVDRYFLSYWALKLLGKRLILSATLDDSVLGILHTYKQSLRPLVLRLIKVFDHYVSISPKLQLETTSLVGAQRSYLIPNGIPYPEFDELRRKRGRARLGIPEDDIALIFLGSICERKDPLFLVENLRYLVDKYSNVRLLIVGPVLEPEYEKDLQRTIKEHDLEDHVVFCGATNTPYTFLEMSDIMVFASRSEGFGTVVIEAMAHGLPVVARHLPGVNDFFVKCGKTGYLFTKNADYLEYVSRLIEDGHLRRTVGIAARSYVLQNFAMPKIAAEYLRLYQGLDGSSSEAKSISIK